METILQQIDALVEKADGRARTEILDGMKALQAKIETPYDTLQRFAGIHLEIATGRIAVNLGIFKILSESQGPISLDELATKTGVTPSILGRILRHLAATNMIGESGKDTYEASSGRIINMPSQPKRFEPLQRVMQITQAGAVPWFAAFPFMKELGDWSAGPALVDIGGGFGHQCLALKAENPSLEGKLVLQDLPQTLALVPKLEGVKIMEHNFFEPQPVKSAKFYYLRNILHDHPDDNCISILCNIIQAFGPGSKILIDEMVLPNSGAHWQSTQIDLTMMSSLASRERTEEQWYELLTNAGLQIESKLQYIYPRGDSIIVAVAK